MILILVGAVLLLVLLMAFSGLIPTLPRTKRRETLLWMHEDSGRDQIGRLVDIDGKKGIVVDGTDLSIIVEWD